MTYRVRNIGIAIALAIVAALLTTFYVTNYKRNVQHGEEMVPVYVAASDIPIGTSGSDVANRKMLKTENVVRRSVVPGAISEPDQIGELVSTEQIYAGEQISTRRFRAAGEQGIRAQLKGNLRAVQVPGSGNQLLLGTLRANDRVDFLGSIELDGVQDPKGTRVFLRNILVLRPASENKVQSKIASGPEGGYSAIFALTDAQAEKLWHVVVNGEWSLQLRPVAEASDSPEKLEIAQTVLGDGLGGGQRKRLNTRRSPR
jgi:Flp pilus assembly protein CpaB